MTETESPATNSKQNPETWVDRYGDYLYRYALSRIHQPELAEDSEGTRYVRYYLPGSATAKAPSFIVARRGSADTST